MSEERTVDTTAKVNFESLEVLIGEALKKQGKALSDSERDRLIKQLRYLQRIQSHRFRTPLRSKYLKDQLANKRAKSKAAKFTGNVATSLGSSAALGLAGAIAAPAAPALAVAGALIGLIGGVWLSYESSKES